MGYIPIVLDSEGAYDSAFVSRLGVDPKRMIVKKVNTILETSQFIASICDKLHIEKLSIIFSLIFDLSPNIKALHMSAESSGIILYSFCFKFSYNLFTKILYFDISPLHITFMLSLLAVTVPNIFFVLKYSL